MRKLPTKHDRGDDALVVRTDFGDEASWQAVVTELKQPWGDGGYEAYVHVVDDPAWAGATPDEVQAAAGDTDDEVCVVFLADAGTMREPHHALLAVKVRYGVEWEDEEEDSAEWAALGLPFRAEPRAVHDVHANLSIANMDFEEFAEAAREDADGVLRPV